MNARAGLAFWANRRDPPTSRRRLANLAKEVREEALLWAAYDSYFRSASPILFIEAETMRLNPTAGLTKTLESGIPGP